MSEATHTTVKEEVLRMIQRLPDDCTLEDVQYHLMVRARVERGLAEARAGQTRSQNEVEQMVQGWAKSSGPGEPKEN